VRRQGSLRSGNLGEQDSGDPSTVPPQTAILAGNLSDAVLPFPHNANGDASSIAALGIPFGTVFIIWLQEARAMPLLSLKIAGAKTELNQPESGAHH